MSPSQCGIRVWEVGVEREVGQTKACTGPLGEGVCGEDKGLVVLTMEISQQTAVMAVSVGEQGVWGHATVSVTSHCLCNTLQPGPVPITLLKLFRLRPPLYCQNPRIPSPLSFYLTFQKISHR